MSAAATSGLEHIIGSTTAGFASTILGHPLDTIKAHLQANPSLRSSLTVARQLQWQGLFRGMAPPLINSIIMNTVMFSVFDGVHNIYPDPFVAGLISGFATAMISTPTDYLKIQAQLHGQPMFPLIQETWRLSPLHFYRGHIANLAREGVFTMAYLGLYFRIKNLQEQDGGQQSLASIAITSSLTGALAWIISFPFDTIKTVIQSRTSGKEDYASILRSRRPADFFKGSATSTGRAMLVTSSRMIAYEFVLGLMRR